MSGPCKGHQSRHGFSTHAFAAIEPLESRRMFDVDPSLLVALGSVEQDAAEAIATDADGDVYAVGSFERAINFDPASAAESQSAQPFGSKGSNDAFIAK